MSSYIGEVSLEGQQYKIGSTLFGTCNTPANTANKRIALSDFDQLMSGITVHIKFTLGNTVSTGATLQFYPDNEENSTANFNVAPISVEGNFICATNSVIAFTLEENQGVNKWYVNNSVNITESATNGNITVNGQNIPVHGLGNAAYTNSNAYATAEQGIKADNAMPKSGGTFTGPIILSNATPTNNLEAATKQYVDNKTSSIDGLSGAMHFVGTATSKPEGSSEPTGIPAYQDDGTMTAGDVVLYGQQEYVWNGSSWQLLGDEGSYALKSNNTTVSFTTNTLPTLTTTPITVPNITNVGSAPIMVKEDVSIPNITNVGTAMSATVAYGVLTITPNTVPTLAATNITATKITSWTDGTAPTQGTDITFDAVGNFNQGGQASINIDGTKVVTTA